MDILKACVDPNLFGRSFKDPTTWLAWSAFLAALFGLPMTPEQLAIYRRHTGRTEPPTEPSRAATLVVGRRGGKTFTMALIAVFLAAFRDYRPHLQRGERALVFVIAADRRQARITMRYVDGLLKSAPMLARMIERETADTFDLTNQSTIEIATASSRTLRGYALAGAICDEVAHWPTADDAVDNDKAIVEALRPALKQIPGSLLLLASSPHARRGALWEAYDRNFGKEGAPLVWQAGTLDMNPTLDAEEIQAEIAQDPAVGAAEYLGQFRVDVEMLLTREVVAAAIDPGVYERPRDPRHRHVAFVDPSGGSADSMSLAIAHQEGDRAVIDAVRDVRPPFQPSAIVAEFSDLLRAYGVRKVVGDRYAGEWPREQFRAQGIEYELSDRPASDLFAALVPAMNSGRVALVDYPRLENQLVGLERRTSRAGRDQISHGPRGHDDAAVCVAGVVQLLLGRRKHTTTVTYNFLSHTDHEQRRRQMQRMREAPRHRGRGAV